MRNASSSGRLATPLTGAAASAISAAEGSVPPPLSITQRFFALKATPPFDRLRDAEIASIAEAAQSRFYTGGDLIFGPSRPLQELLVVVWGEWVFAGENVDAYFDDIIDENVIGVLSLLFDTKTRGSLLTPEGGGGLQCLVISKAHFFTAVNECPALMAGFLELYDVSDEGYAAESEMAPDTSAAAA